MSEEILKVEKEIDSTKLSRMCMKIYAAERQNTLTNEHTDSEMVEKIKKIIEEETKKCY